VEVSSTESASGMSNWDNAWQRPANPDTSAAGIALQSAEACKADRLSRRPNGFGRGHLVGDTLVERLAGGEECKWGRCLRPGAGAMGNGLSSRETRRRYRRCYLRQNPHPWRRGVGEVESSGSSLEWRLDRSR
jgi:hypothetical protein